jgi:serine/threonine-protein kinase
MLTAEGAKLLDFGLAKLDASRGFVTSGLTAAPTEEKPLTAKGAIVGTFHHMAPEQLEGWEPDPPSDIWALGLLIHEMAAGARPFEGKSRAGVIAAILERDPPSLAAVRPGTPPALDRLVAAAS